MAKALAAKVTKRRKKGHGWSKRRLPRSWPARAILEENRDKYLIQWEPVGSGAELERTWEPKCHANALLVADWEARQKASLQGKRKSKQGGTSKQPGDGNAQSGMEQDCRSRNSMEDLPPEAAAADSEIKERGSDDNSPDTQASCMLLEEVLQDEHGDEDTGVNRGTFDHETPRSKPTNIATTTCEHDSEKVPPRPGTSISTLLSPASFTFVDDKGHERARNTESSKMQPVVRTMAQAAVSTNRNPAASGPSPGRLSSARETLRSFLRGAGKKRRERSIFSPPP